MRLGTCLKLQHSPSLAFLRLDDSCNDEPGPSQDTDVTDLRCALIESESKMAKLEMRGPEGEPVPVVPDLDPAEREVQHALQRTRSVEEYECVQELETPGLPAPNVLAAHGEPPMLGCAVGIFQGELLWFGGLGRRLVPWRAGRGGGG